jgi:DNA-binding transcriptional regulator YdaS (Cro superfamily)
MHKSHKSTVLGSTDVPTVDHNQNPPRDRHGFRGVPPMPTFSLASLPPDCLLTTYDVASVLRVSTNTVDAWRRQPDHPLKWITLPNGFVRCTAGALRAYLNLGQQHQQPPNAEAKLIAAPAEPAPILSKPDHAQHVLTAAAPKRLSALERAIAVAGSQQKLADAAGVHTNTIWKLANGHYHMTRRVALAIEHAVNGKVRAEELLFEGVKRLAQRNKQQTNKRRTGASDKIVEEAAE